MYTIITKCRACDTPEEKLISVFKLGVQPLANNFVKMGEPHAGYAPLEVLFCPRCSLAQLSVVVDPEILYSNYSYVTSPSQTMREHFNSVLADVLTEQKPGSVVEIGSNDGLFLAFLSDHGFGNVVGIDPAKNLTEKAKSSGIITVNDFFGPESAHAARTAAGEVGLIVARHVFCHVDDWAGFVKSLGILASKDTLICIEVPYVVDQLSIGSFDQVYHEHTSYLSLKSMKALLADSPFHLHRVIRYPIHRGTVLIMLRRNDCAVQPHPCMDGWLANEDIVTLEWWQRFGDTAEIQIVELRNKIRDLVTQGKRVCGYGASAKSTVWINACGFTHKEIEFVTDTTPQKQGRLIPGTKIPIVDGGALLRETPDYAVLFAWNYATEILEKEKPARKQGVKFIVPVPKLRVIGIDSIESEA